MEYVRMPLGVEARFYSDGTVIPRTLRFAAKKYEIDRIISRRPHNPGTVSCVAPIEYVVVIEGTVKHIYFEPETCQWFSVKEQKNLRKL